MKTVGKPMVPEKAGIEGRRLTPWKTIECSGKTKANLLRLVMPQLAKVVRYIVRTGYFNVSRTAQQIDLVIVTPKDFGFRSSQPAITFMLAPFLEEWSKKHLDGQVIELCTLEDCLELRLQYNDQPDDNRVYVLVNRIAGYSRFVVGCFTGDDFWLGVAGGAESSESDLLRSDLPLVFRLRNVT